MATRGVRGRLGPRASHYVPVERVDVFLWGEHLGAVALDPAYQFYAFRYVPGFRQSGIEPAPLQMPLAEDRTFLFTDLPQETYRRLPALLNDALPDDFGNALINRWMADRGVSAANVTPLDRLAYMSNRAMGALQFRPARGPATRIPAAVEMSALVHEARKALAGTLEDADHAQAALRSIIEVGTSAGGARAKAVIAWNPSTQEIRAGQLDAPPGFEHWLLKFDGMGVDRDLGAPREYGRIEYAYALMAREAGLAMTESRLLEENGRAHFMTRRFDREPGDVRHHVSTLCAMGHLDYRRKRANSYAQLFDVIERLHLPYADREEAFRRMVFNVMGRNCDDHTKNISFRLRRRGRWELAPAYDVTFAHNPASEWTHEHLMSVHGKFRDFTVDDLLAEADRFVIGTAPAVIERVRMAIREWPRFAALARLSAAETARIAGLLLPLD